MKMKGRYLLTISVLIALALSMYIYVVNGSIIIKDEHNKQLDFEGNFNFLKIYKSSDLTITIHGKIGTVKVKSSKNILIKAYGIEKKEVSNSQNVRFEIIQPAPPPPSPPGRHSVYLDTNRGGMLLGAVEFQVAGDYSYIRVDHHIYKLKRGDNVKLIVDGARTARLYITSSSINAFETKAEIYINGQFKTKGSINQMWISNYVGFRSTLRLLVEKKWAWTDFRWDGVQVIHGKDNSQITIFDLSPNGVLNLNLKRSSIYLSGSASKYTMQPSTPITPTITPTVPTTTPTPTPIVTPTLPTTTPTITPTQTITVPTPQIYRPYNNSPAINVYYPPGNPGGYLLTIGFTLNGPIKLTNVYGDLLSKEIYANGHGARVQLVGYVQTYKYISLQINDYRIGKHVIKIEASAPAGVEIGVKSRYDSVTYVTRNVWVVTSSSPTFSITLEIYTLPIASGVRNIGITITTI